MIYRPLFGQDSNPRTGSTLLSSVITFFFWAIIFICLKFVKLMPEQKKFETVQIVLAEKEFAQEIVSEAEVEAETAKQTQAKEAAQSQKTEKIEKTQKIKKEEASSKKQNNTSKEKTNTKKIAKTQENKTVKENSKTPSYKLSKSVEEQMLEQQKAAKKTSTADFDWSTFDDNNAKSSSSQSSNQKVTAKSSFSGTAGTAHTESKNNSNDVKTSVGKDTVSSSTQSNLDAIKNATGSSVSDNNQSSSSSQSSVSSGKISLTWDGEGEGRQPRSKIEIKLSDSAKQLIDHDYRILISLKVDRSGNVLRTSIEIPNALLASKVKEEIIEEISKWLFEPAANTSEATFTYNIVIK